MAKFIALLFAIVFITSTAAVAQTGQINWEKDFKKALTISLQNGKPILLVFTSPDCQACKDMDEQYWATEPVIASVRQFVAVRVNFGSEQPLAAKYNISEAPFVAFTDPLGNLISFRRGFDKDTPRRLNTALKDVPKDFSGLEKSYQAIERRKDDGTALLKIADTYRKLGNLHLSNEFYERAAKTPEVKGDAGQKERVSFAFAVNAVGYRNYKQAAEYSENYLNDYPKGKYRETAFTLLIVSNANLAKFKETDEYLSKLKTKFPNSENIPVAVKAIENGKNKLKK